MFGSESVEGGGGGARLAKAASGSPMVPFSDSAWLPDDAVPPLQFLEDDGGAKPGGPKTVLPPSDFIFSSCPVDDEWPPDNLC